MSGEIPHLGIFSICNRRSCDLPAVVAIGGRRRFVNAGVPSIAMLSVLPGSKLVLAGGSGFLVGGGARRVVTCERQIKEQLNTA